MSYTMFLDDIREPIFDYDCIVRSYNMAKLVVYKRGCPTHISFDHDLSTEKTGYDFAKYLVELDLDGIIDFPDNFTFCVHSANPVGKENIETYLNNYLDMKFGATK